MNSLLAAWVNGYINTGEMVPRQDNQTLQSGQTGKHRDTCRKRGETVRAALNGAKVLTGTSSERLRENKRCSEQPCSSLQTLAT